MKRRTETILRLLAETEGYITIERIARETDAGVRTIHRDLETLERSLALRGVRLERRRGVGIRLLDPLPDAVRAGRIAGNVEHGISSDLRPMMVLVYLISADDWTKVSELAHAFFVSDSSILSDLYAISRFLPENVQLDRQKGVGVRVTGNEVSIRRLYLGTFPWLFPMYAIRRHRPELSADGPPKRRDAVGRVIDAMELSADYDRFVSAIETVGETLGFPLAPAYASLVYGYLHLLDRRRRPVDAQLGVESALAVPPRYGDAAGHMLTRAGLAAEAERPLLARVLSGCEPAMAPRGAVRELLGGLAHAVDGIIERTLGSLEERERAWLHGDSELLGYLRVTVAAAARRLDLAVPARTEFPGLGAPVIEASVEANTLTREFVAAIGPLIPGLDAARVRRELTEATLALGARLETIRRRRATRLRVRILCYEGLGMASYLRALAQQVLPAEAVIDASWDPEFSRRPEASTYDLVISTYDLAVGDVPVLVIDPGMAPEGIRNALRSSMEVAVSRVNESGESDEPTAVAGESLTGEEDDALSLPVVMSVINSFFVVHRDPRIPLIEQAVSALDRGDCDREMMTQDFHRREGYGQLEFEELNVRLLHCRTNGVPEPRAGVIQTGDSEPTVLVLAAPVGAPAAETRVLSELVVALTESPVLPRAIVGDGIKSIQAVLLGLFGRRLH